MREKETVATLARIFRVKNRVTCDLRRARRVRVQQAIICAVSIFYFERNGASM